MRIYSPLAADDLMVNVKLKTFLTDYSFVDLCNVTRVHELHNITRPLSPATWRFLPLLDPMVDRFVSRDCDTVMTRREVEAVCHWLTESEATFHMMRDHQMHCEAKILGGTFLYSFI